MATMNLGTSGRNVSPEQIAKRAYEIWEGSGRPDGQDAAHWFQAEAELSAQTAQPEPRRSTASATKSRTARRTQMAVA